MPGSRPFALRSATSRSIAICIAAMLFAGCQSTATRDDTTTSAVQVGDVDGDLRVVAELPPPPETDGGADVRISENDLLQIDVFQVGELSRRARVDSRGNISMQLIGQVHAAGLTVPELEQRLEAQYGRNYLQSPEITVFVEEAIGQRVTMDGEFRRPGFVPVTAQSTLLRAVAQAGGLTQIGNPERVFVFRDFGGSKLVANYSLADIRKADAADPRVYGGDVIVAFPSGARIASRNLREAFGLATSATVLAAPL